MIRTLALEIFDLFPHAAPFEFAVEIDPTLVDAAKIEALAEMGMNRASMGIQDFDPLVLAAIAATRHTRQRAPAPICCARQASRH